MNNNKINIDMEISTMILLTFAYLLIIAFLAVITEELQKVNETLKDMNRQNAFTNKPQNIEYR